MHRSLVGIALSEHTERSRSNTVDNLREWLGREVPAWTVHTLLELQGGGFDPATLRAVDAMVVSKEKTARALKLVKGMRFKVLRNDGSPTPTYEWVDLRDLRGEDVYVSMEPDADAVHRVWEDGAVVVEPDLEGTMYQLRETFGWEVL